MSRLHLAGGALALVACAAAAFAPAPKSGNAALAARPVASIQELMTEFVDPSADAIWEAVSSETGPNGIEEHFPRTPQEWAVVRRHALNVVEAANLLLVPGRKVSHTGQLEDAHVPGILTAPQVQKAIDGNRAAFGAHVLALQEAGKEVLAAVDARNTQRLLVAGEKLDAACESCHATYWYPNEKIPGWPAPLKARQ